MDEHRIYTLWKLPAEGFGDTPGQRVTPVPKEQFLSFSEAKAVAENDPLATFIVNDEGQTVWAKDHSPA
jgi:hypothetical protein